MAWRLLVLFFLGTALSCLAAKIMADEDYCQSCMQRHDCREIYGKLGHSEGPSIALRVVIVFLAPIVVFIVSLAAFERAAGLVTSMAAVRTGVGLAGALVVTFGWILAAKVIDRRVGSKGVTV